jgi:glycosyltransferase involved in cell wall biosynthesis
MSDVARASIIISSYNYGRFLAQTIDSALGQTHPDTEVIVVDDGSTDNSRAVLAAYGNRITTVLKDTAGQASALNAGLILSRGDVVLFLDSDDLLLPTAVATAMPHFRDCAVAKVHWPLWEIDEHGKKSGALTPRAALPEGDLRQAVLHGGADGYTWPPTSGNAWARRCLDRVFPLPEAEYRTCPDFYLATLIPLYGLVGRIVAPQGCWRVHRYNQSWADSREIRLEAIRRREEHCLAELDRRARAMGLQADLEACRDRSWWQCLRRVRAAAQDIEALVPVGATFILVNEDTWDEREVAISGRRVLPFLEKDGRYWGQPADDATAVRELERLRRRGASFLVFAWPALWWLDYYVGFAAHLRASFPCVLANERLRAFDLRAGAGPGLRVEGQS